MGLYVILTLFVDLPIFFSLWITHHTISKKLIMQAITLSIVLICLYLVKYLCV